MTPRGPRTPPLLPAVGLREHSHGPGSRAACVMGMVGEEVGSTGPGTGGQVPSILALSWRTRTGKGTWEGSFPYDSPKVTKTTPSAPILLQPRLGPGTHASQFCVSPATTLFPELWVSTLHTSPLEAAPVLRLTCAWLKAPEQIYGQEAISQH